MTLSDPPTAVMDATCDLCSWGARMIHWLDKSGEIKIAPIQSDIGAALMRDTGLLGRNVYAIFGRDAVCVIPDAKFCARLLS